MPALSLRGRIWIVASLLLAPLAPAGHGPAATVDFAPRVESELQRYGDEQGAVLRAAILAAVSRETARVAAPSGLEISVLVQDVAPTHPTRRQLSDEPALDVVHTKYLGGAELSASLRDATGRVLATVRYRHFAPTLRLGSASPDAWADARLAIDQFAAKLAAACSSLSAR